MKSVIGCGTITSVKKLNQMPLYDRAYESSQVGGNGNSEAVLMTAVLGPLAGVAALVVGEVLSSSREPDVSAGGVRAPEDGIWKNVRAVSIAMDDGQVLNLPLTVHASYTDGMRVKLFSLQDRKSIQLMALSNIPPVGGKTYTGWCGRTLDDSLAEEALKDNANLVQQDKITE